MKRFMPVFLFCRWRCPRTSRRNIELSGYGFTTYADAHDNIEIQRVGGQRRPRHPVV
jgi:hypothetical protein